MHTQAPAYHALGCCRRSAPRPGPCRTPGTLQLCRRGYRRWTSWQPGAHPCCSHRPGCTAPPRSSSCTCSRASGRRPPQWWRCRHTPRRTRSRPLDTSAAGTQCTVVAVRLGPDSCDRWMQTRLWLTRGHGGLRGSIRPLSSPAEGRATRVSSWSRWGLARGAKASDTGMATPPSRQHQARFSYPGPPQRLGAGQHASSCLCRGVAWGGGGHGALVTPRGRGCVGGCLAGATESLNRLGVHTKRLASERVPSQRTSALHQCSREQQRRHQDNPGSLHG